MKKLLVVSLLGGLMVGLLGLPSFAGFVSVATTEGYIYTTTNSDEKNIDIGTPPYYPLQILAKNKDCSWYKVKDWMRTTGWIPAEQVCSDQTVIVNKIKINWRSGPGTGYRNLGKLYKGYILQIIGRKGYWLKVKLVDPLKNKVGWVHRRLVWGD